LTSETIDGVNRQIGYDKIDQVKSVTGSNSEAYTYDANGNRTNNGYVTGVNNQLLNDSTYKYEYDGEGNRTKRTKIVGGAVDNYTWDYRNRLTGVISQDASAVVTQTVSYEYDVDNQRVSKTVNGVVEKYVIDRDQIAYVTDSSGTQTFHYLYGTNVDAVMAQDSPTGMVWSLSDRLGSVNLLTDASGVVVDKRTFDSFGRVLSETNPGVKFRYGYTGREQDQETGLDYYRARYYDAANGRFISVDPIGFEAGDTNLYRYVGNKSTLATDPSGLQSTDNDDGLIGLGSVIIAALVKLFAPAINFVKDSQTNSDSSPSSDKYSQLPPFPNPNNDRLRLGNGSLVTYPSDLLPRFPGTTVVEGFPANPGEIFQGIPGFDVNHGLSGSSLLERFPGNSGEIFQGIPGFDLSPVPTTTNTGSGWQDNSWLPQYVFNSEYNPFNPNAIWDKSLNLDDLADAANDDNIEKPGWTKAGHKLTKHGNKQRGSSPFPPLIGTNTDINQVAAQQIQDILTDPDAVFVRLGRGGLEVRIPDGRGARWEADGSFNTFVD
jgi:RHS repeat-associated protein